MKGSYGTTANVLPATPYGLRKYAWRASLGIAGPLLLVLFYAFICFYYPNRQPQNDILASPGYDSTAPFYAWFITSIFTLDWARSALANFEAAALMKSFTSPTTAMQLFWHADSAWADPLWWLRAARNSFLQLYPGQTTTRRLAAYRVTPEPLWTFLSMLSMIVFVAIPLSGLTMELSSVSSPTRRYAEIIGLGPETLLRFTGSNGGQLPIIHGAWRSGAPATPSDESYFYAPSDTANVSLTYFEDMARDRPDQAITTILGSAVTERTTGTIFGIKSTVHCYQVASDELTLMDVHDFPDGYSLSIASDADNNTQYISSDGEKIDVATADSDLYNDYTNDTPRPFYSAFIPGGLSMEEPLDKGGDPATILRLCDKRDNEWFDLTKPKLSTFDHAEVSLWQAVIPEANDSTVNSLVNDTFSLLRKGTFDVETVHSSSTSPEFMPVAFVGFAVQCSIQAAVGQAKVNPSTRTFDNFSEIPWQDMYSNHTTSPYPLTALAHWAFGEGRLQDYWNWIHEGLGQSAVRFCSLDDCSLSDNTTSLDGSSRYPKGSRYPALSPHDMMLSLYRLYGHTLITTLGAHSEEPRTSPDLFVLESARWLKPGPVPWQLVLGLLAIWAIAVASLSAYTLFTRRWAPILNGFELFRFGAQYGEQVNDFRTGRFETCDELNNIPGMVGVLAGTGTDAKARAASEGFIGLSEREARSDGRFVYDRRKAAGKAWVP